MDDDKLKIVTYIRDRPIKRNETISVDLDVEKLAPLLYGLQCYSSSDSLDPRFRHEWIVELNDTNGGTYRFTYPEKFTKRRLMNYLKPLIENMLNNDQGSK
jgi:hypothetical protein